MDSQNLTDLQKLEAWIADNEAKFSTYSIGEIAELSIAAGFNRIAVAQWQTQQRFRGVV
jgi:hypothetical protein